MEQAQMQREAGWFPGKRASTGCEAANQDGVRVCTSCDANGNCEKHVERAFNPIEDDNPDADTSDEWDSRTELEKERIEVIPPSRPKKKQANPQKPKDDAKEKPKAAEPPKSEAPQPKQAATSQTPPSPTRPKQEPKDPPSPQASNPPSAAPSQKSEPHTPPPTFDRDVDPVNIVEKPEKRADPVLIGDGSLQIEQVDLSFEGPVVPLQFIRAYNSRSDERSTLGSNWRHNWDVRIQKLTPDTLPEWAAPYCGGANETATCLLLHQGDGSVQMFFLDLGSYLYVPQAGSTDTIARTEAGGWALRSSDGHIRYFNALGYLVEDRDRFGNGFRIELEPTPLRTLYEYFCSAEALLARKETKHSRRCSVLAYLNEDGPRPPRGDAWFVTESDFPLPAVPELVQPIGYARDFFLALIAGGPNSSNIYGFCQMRPKRVIDDLDRTLEFAYYEAPLVPVVGGIRRKKYDFDRAPEAELLREIRGPGGTRLGFSYSGPASYPKELHERFLSVVDRTDAVSATSGVQQTAPRSIRFQYQWAGGAINSYLARAKVVRSRFLAYYRTFVGCTYQDAFDCPGGRIVVPLVREGTGSPGDLATREMNAYSSQVADNIVKVVDSGTVESETRYEPNPFSAVFDRVSAQRYGSAQAVPPPLPVPGDRNADSWSTGLPKAVFDYQEAGPISTELRPTSRPGFGRIGSVGAVVELAQPSPEDEDLTDAFLPSEIRTRYPLEPLPAQVDEQKRHPVVGARGPGGCKYDEMESRRRGLPGYRKQVSYYEAPGISARPNGDSRLYRCRLTAEQLSRVQMGDPTHNGLLHALRPLSLGDRPTTARTRQSMLTAIRLMGRRRELEANANRIVSWTRMIDRDGDTRYFGLNYRGQVLVEAVKERDTGQFLFLEQLYNADGSLLQLRRTTRGPVPFSVKAGYTEYEYDEIEPEGNRGWNGWLPVFWSRRANLVRVTEHAAGNGVLNEEELTTGFATGVGRYREFRYEPLFNQVQWSESGSIELRSGARTDIPHSRQLNVFDYQELSWDDPSSDSHSVAPLLDSLRPWGFNWLTSWRGRYDRTLVSKWQLPLPMYAGDLNGDGETGFIEGESGGSRGRGVPVMVITTRPGSAGEPLVTTLGWAPHGKPAFASLPGGEGSIFEYYSIEPSGGPGLRYGTDNPPLDAAVSSGYRGLLARVRSLRFSGDYDLQSGPPDAPCAALAGPYQWVLPATCGDPRSDLVSLGLPTETVNAVLESTVEDGRFLSKEFSYSELGLVRRSWSETGTTETVRDTDGRVLESIDLRKTRRQQTYTSHGLPEWTRTFDASGNRIGEAYQEHDEEGRLTYECAALTRDGCLPQGARQPKNGVVRQYRYYPEGSVHTTIDPEGMVTKHTYNERQLLVHEEISHPNFPGQQRSTSYAYNTDDDVFAIHYGDPSGSLQGVLREGIFYDGLRRPTGFLDKRGSMWRLAYSGRDLLMRFKQAEIPYGQASGSTPIWETKFLHDDAGAVVRRLDNGVVTARYSRSPDGSVYTQSSAGIGNTFTTYDRLGRINWTRDAVGNQTVHTWRSESNTETNAVIRLSPDGRRLTTASLKVLDAAGMAEKEITLGGTIELQTSFIRDGAGRVTTSVDPEGHRTIYERNWLGWPTRVRQQRDDASPPGFDVASFTYNNRGQVHEMFDPAVPSQRTEFDYDGFGAISSRTTRGQPAVGATFSYDLLGRLDVMWLGPAQIRHRYDLRGDLELEEHFENGHWNPMIDRYYDDLGRVTHSTNRNVALSWLPEQDRTVTTEFSYDEIGRRRGQGIQVGTGATHFVGSKWSVLAGDVWQRISESPSRLGLTSWQENYDPIGRLAKKRQIHPGAAGFEARFSWIGEHYLGREQTQPGHASPFRERFTLDAMGSLARSEYRAIDLDASGSPVNRRDGVAYCGAGWSQVECGEPILDSRIIRNSVGRIASLDWKFAHPVFNGPTRTTANHAQPWRGYTYTARAQLDAVWEHRGNSPVIDPGGLDSYSITASEIEALGAAAEHWTYSREEAIGATTGISNVSTASRRWSLPIPRGPGHQIRQVEIDNQVRALTYDTAGRIITDGGLTLAYDPKGWLSQVISAGSMLEGYLYDAQGRLAGLLTPSQQVPPALSFCYDGDQITAGFNNTDDLVWEASWGPGLDQLLEWRDYVGNTGANYPLVDHRNSVVSTWETSQSRLSEIAEYTPEGRLALRSSAGDIVCEETSVGGVCPNPAGLPFGLFSAWRSPRTGLVYLRNRWYSPELAQFIAHDPFGYVDSYNPYTYAAYDPINRWDPMALTSQAFSDRETLSKEKPMNHGATISAISGNPIQRPWMQSEYETVTVTRETIIKWIGHEDIPHRASPLPANPNTLEFNLMVTLTVNSFLAEAARQIGPEATRYQILDRALSSLIGLRGNPSVQGSSESLILRNAERYLWGRVGAAIARKDYGHSRIKSEVLGPELAPFYQVPKVLVRPLNALLDAFGLPVIPMQIDRDKPMSAIGGSDWFELGFSHYLLFDRESLESKSKPPLLQEFPKD